MASEKLILIEDVQDLGLAGEEVNVASGYARNFLIPRKLATKASKGALRQLDARKEKIEARRKGDLDRAQALAEKIATTEISISMQASEDDQLFGSVTERTLSEKFAEHGIELPHQKIKMDEHVKQLGMFTVEIKLHPEVSTTAKIWVVRT